MEIRWGKRTPSKPVPDQVVEDAAKTIVSERRFASAMDEIMANHERDGGFDNLEGKGKPLNLDGEVTENYYLTKVLKNARVLPEWLELQHKIRDELVSLLEQMDRYTERQIDGKLEQVNGDIRKYNEKCPNHLFQKRLVTRANLVDQMKEWQ